MNNNLFQTEYDVTHKTKLKRFYENHKFKIISFLLLLAVLIIAFFFYLEVKKNKKISLTEKYVAAKTYIDNEKKNEAIKSLVEIIHSNDSTYSPLSLFLIIDTNLIDDKQVISGYFSHILKNCKFEKEIENLIILKKALFVSSFASEAKLLESLRPILNSESLWKSHSLFLLGDYYLAKSKKNQAREFYLKVLEIKNLDKVLYERARIQILLTAND